MLQQSRNHQPTRKNSLGTQLWGPAGGGVWNTATIDAKLHALYVGTGNACVEPAPERTDALLALDLDTGKVLRVAQDLNATKNSLHLSCFFDILVVLWPLDSRVCNAWRQSHSLC